MKNKWILGAVAAIAMAATSAQAISISGTIDMAGSVSLNTMLLGDADNTTSIGPVVVGGTPTGSFAGVPPFATLVSWSNFGWNPSTTPVAPLWSFVSGGWTYSFDLLSVTIDQQSNSFLNLLGTGVLKITGPGSPYDPTAGDWSFTISNAGGGAHANFAFTFANSQTAAVPDGGVTVMLLGAALSGLGLARRKFMA